MVTCIAERFTFPPLPLQSWEETKDTLHLFLQIVGKIRLKYHPKLNHWWHAALYPNTNGLTTGRIPYKGGSFEIAFNFLTHALEIQTDQGCEAKFSLMGLSVAGFYEKTFRTLGELGISVSIYPHPYLQKSTIPFPEDTVHGAYDPEAVTRFWQILDQIAGIFETFRGRFVGKSTPVHLFWHSFDLALTRFSGRPAPPRTSGTRVDQEAYSHEVISFGFWAGDETFPEPAFYAYVYPAPAQLSDPALQPPLEPKEAFWGNYRGSTMALLRYEDWRKLAEPRAVLLAFLESAYQAGAQLAQWPSLVPSSNP